MKCILGIFKNRTGNKAILMYNAQLMTGSDRLINTRYGASCEKCKMN